MILSQPQIFAEKVFYYENVLPDPEKFVEKIEGLPGGLLVSDWEDWYASDGSDFFGMKKSTSPENYNNSSDDEKMVFNTLHNILDSYAIHYSEAVDLSLGTKMPISISKYFTGAFMGPHTDSGPTPTTENISAVLYLNDDYEGGEISFPKQGINIKPSAGSLVIFPSTPPFFHESKLIISGTKYMSPAFWHLFV